MTTLFAILVGLALAVLALAAIYDFLAYHYFSYQYTITCKIRKASKDYPFALWLFGFVVGLIIGHLYC